MRRTASTVLAFLVCNSPSMAFAEDVSSTSSTAKVTLTPRKIDIDGSPFVALPVDQMGRVELRLEAADKLEGLSTAQDGLISAQKLMLETESMEVARAKELVAENAALARDLKDLSDKQAQKIDELSSWYHSPILWTGVGAVGVAVLGALLFSFHGGGSTINVQK